jgi:hypothetical protein
MKKRIDGAKHLAPNWIDELTDSQCMEIFWLYVDPPEDFLARHPPALLGKAMRHALRQVVDWAAKEGESWRPGTP